MQTKKQKSDMIQLLLNDDCFSDRKKSKTLLKGLGLGKESYLADTLEFKRPYDWVESLPNKFSKYRIRTKRK